MESKVVTAVGISVNGHHPVHAERIRKTMEHAVLKHHVEHGGIDDEKHGELLRSKIKDAHDAELRAITGELG